MMFRSMLIPEAKSEHASNITMHQLLRLCYSDQRTPVQRLFRFEQFDTHSIREAVGDLVCGVNDFELYEVTLELREQQKRLKEVTAELRALQNALPVDEKECTPEQIETDVSTLRNEAICLREEIDRVEELVETLEAETFLEERKTIHADLIKERKAITDLESTEKNLQFELREIEQFLAYLGELKEKIGYSEATSAVIGSIEFSHCPACGEELEESTHKSQCVLCKLPIDTEKDKSRYNQIRLDLEIQARESRQLIEQKRGERSVAQQKLRVLRREHEKKSTEFNLRFARANGPRDAFLAVRTKRLGHIEAEIDFLLRSGDIAKQIAELLGEQIELEKGIERLNARKDDLSELSEIRRPKALSTVSDFTASLLRSDMKRQVEFVNASRVDIDFRNDSISVDESVNFAESSNVILKNSAILGLLLAAVSDHDFLHPRFILIDNIEDKGLEQSRSHQFQQILVDRVANLEMPHQVIFTTSMMNSDLDLERYTIGPAYTNANRSLSVTS